MGASLSTGRGENSRSGKSFEVQPGPAHLCILILLTFPLHHFINEWRVSGFIHNWREFRQMDNTSYFSIKRNQKVSSTHKIYPFLSAREQWPIHTGLTVDVGLFTSLAYSLLEERPHMDLQSRKGLFYTVKLQHSADAFICMLQNKCSPSFVHFALFYLSFMF